MSTTFDIDQWENRPAVFGASEPLKSKVFTEQELLDILHEVDQISGNWRPIDRSFEGLPSDAEHKLERYCNLPHNPRSLEIGRMAWCPECGHLKYFYGIDYLCFGCRHS